MKRSDLTQGLPAVRSRAARFLGLTRSALCYRIRKYDLATAAAADRPHNPELQAKRREVDMRVARSAPAGALPDPTLSVGDMGGLQGHAAGRPEGAARDLPAARAAADPRARARQPAQIVSRGQQGLALAKKEVLPDFSVNVTSQRFIGGMPWMYGVDFMVKVPLYWQRKQRPMIAEAAAALDAGRRMRENTLPMATAQVTEEHLAGAARR